MISALLIGSSPATAKAGPDGFSELAAKLLPAVVNISTTQTLKADRQRPEVPQFPPGSPFEEFFKDFLDKNLPRGQRPDAQPRRATSLGCRMFSMHATAPDLWRGPMRRRWKS